MHKSPSSLLSFNIPNYKTRIVAEYIGVSKILNLVSNPLFVSSLPIRKGGCVFQPLYNKTARLVKKTKSKTGKTPRRKLPSSSYFSCLYWLEHCPTSLTPPRTRLSIRRMKSGWRRKRSKTKMTVIAKITVTFYSGIIRRLSPQPKDSP